MMQETALVRHNQLTSALHLIHRKIDALGGELKIFMTLLLEQGEGLFEQSAEMQAELLNTLSPLVDMAQKASSTTFAIALKDINGAGLSGTIDAASTTSAESSSVNTIALRSSSCTNAPPPMEYVVAKGRAKGKSAIASMEKATKAAATEETKPAKGAAETKGTDAFAILADPLRLPMAKQTIKKTTINAVEVTPPQSCPCDAVAFPPAVSGQWRPHMCDRRACRLMIFSRCSSST